MNNVRCGGENKVNKSLKKPPLPPAAPSKAAEELADSLDLRKSSDINKVRTKWEREEGKETLWEYITNWPDVLFYFFHSQVTVRRCPITRCWWRLKAGLCKTLMVGESSYLTRDFCRKIYLLTMDFESNVVFIYMYFLWTKDNWKLSWEMKFSAISVRLYFLGWFLRKSLLSLFFFPML